MHVLDWSALLIAVLRKLLLAWTELLRHLGSWGLRPDAWTLGGIDAAEWAFLSWLVVLEHLGGRGLGLVLVRVRGHVEGWATAELFVKESVWARKLVVLAELVGAVSIDVGVLLLTAELLVHLHHMHDGLVWVLAHATRQWQSQRWCSLLLFFRGWVFHVEVWNVVLLLGLGYVLLNLSVLLSTAHLAHVQVCSVQEGVWMLAGCLLLTEVATVAGTWLVTRASLEQLLPVHISNWNLSSVRCLTSQFQVLLCLFHFWMNHL